MRGAAAFLRGFLDSALPLLALLALLSALLRFLPPRASVRAPFFPGEELPSPFPSRHALSSARPVVRPPYRSSSFSPARSSSFTSPVRRPPCAPACHARSPLPTRALRIQALRLVHVTPALPLCLLILSAIPLSVPIPPPPTLPFRPCTTRPCTTCHSMHGGQQEEVGQWEEAQEQSADAATTMLLAALRRLKSEPQRQRLARGLPGCVLYADDRRLSASSLRAAGSDSFEAHGREFPYWLATKLINRAYAQRHGYRFVEMGEADKEPGRHPSWFKVRFLQRQLACCCEWAFFLDSDAYFRMDNHRLSVQSWVDRLTLPHYFDWIARDYNISLANQTWFPRPPSSIFSHSPPACPPSPVGGGQGGGEGEAGEVEHGGWGRGGEGESRAAVCVVAPRNDDEASGMAEGRAGALFNGSMEYVNAGVTLWRRSPHCLKVRCETRSPHCLKVLLLLPAPPFSSLLLLPLGLNPSAQSTQAIEPGTHPHAPPLLSLTHLSLAPLYQPLFFVPTPTPSQLLASWHEEPAKQYLWRRNWEQPRLNVLLAMPQHVADVAVVPFRELTGHSGRAIRHRWLNSIMTDETRSDLEHHQKSARGLAQACPKPPQAWAGRWEGEAGRWKGETGRWDGERGRWEGEMGRWEGETGRWEGEMGSEEGKLCWQEGKMGRREGEMTKTGKDGEAGWGDGSAERENGDSLVTISPATAAASAAASGRAGTEWDRAYVSRPNCCVRGGERGHGGRRTQCGPARRRRDGHQAKGGPAGQHGAAS
ncbi:unnamed protein product [Closterium sp. NIES-54]